MSNSVFTEFDFVWAKFMNFNHWPAIIVKPNDNVKEKQPSKDAQWVYFLGDHNYAWVAAKNIKPYEEFRSRYKNKKVEKPMREMETYIRQKELDPDYEVPISKFVGKKTASKSKKKTQVSRKRGRKKSISDNKETPASPAKIRYADSDSDISEKSDDSIDFAKTSKFNCSDYIIGFFAGSSNAEYILTKFLDAHLKVCVWFENKILAEKLDYLQDYAKENDVFFRVCSTPQIAVACSMVTFSCLSNADQAKSMVKELVIADKNHGFLKGRTYIEMTSIVSDLSKEHCSLIKGRGGIYVEAMIQGNIDTDLLVILSGPAVERFTACFEAIGSAIHVGEAVGLATDYHMAFQMLRGNMLVSLAEGLALANQTGFSLPQMRGLFRIMNLKSDYIDSKIASMINQNYREVNEPMQQLQKDLAQSLRVFDKLKHPTPLTANAHELLKHCCSWGYGELDASKIYQKIRY